VSARPKVLVVDDDADLQRALAVRLRAAGFDSAFASDAVTALAVANRERPDAIVLDLGLPGGDGFVVLQRIRNSVQVNDVPVVVLSARDAEGNRERALEAGARAYFAKPADDDALIGEIRRAVAERSSAAQAGSRRILIVEDDEDIARALNLRLRAAGYETSVAADAVAVVGSARQFDPDLVLLDLGLPGGGGYAVLERLRTLATLAAVPVVVLSAWDREVNEPRALAEGATAFLSKPVDIGLLLQVVDEHLREAAPTPRAGADPVR
jgi:DNA-binding response OmpR family regulator